MAETSYKVDGHSSKRRGVFVRYSIIAVICIVMLAVLTAAILLATFYGPGRRSSSSEACDKSNGRHTSRGKTF